MFWKTSKSSSALFYEYENILLKLYLEVARSGDFRKLIRSGNPSNEECLESWEKLVKRQEKETGTHKYSAFLQLIRGYTSLLADHTMIRACLIRCAIVADWEYIKILKDKGYNIVCEPANAYKESIKAGLRKCENLITKAEMKRKEIERMFKGSEVEEHKGFEEVLAGLNFALGFTVNEDITLARFNEYNKILKAKQKASEQQQNGSRNQQGRYNKR